MFFNIFSLPNCLYTFSDKIKYFILSFIFYFLLAVVSVFIINFIDFFVTESLNMDSISDLFSASRKKIDSNHNIFKIVIFAPFVEELLFRLPLIYRKRNLAIFTFITTFFILNGSIFSVNFNYFFTLTLFVSLLLSVLIFYNFRYFHSFLVKYSRYIVMISITLFGLIHVYNIEPLHLNLILFYPFYVLPQMIMGYFVSNLRIKFGFLWGFALHSFINLIGSLHLLL